MGAARGESRIPRRVGAGHLPPGARVVEHRGRMLVTGGAPDKEALDMAADYFEAKERQGGMADAMMRFAQPLLEEAGDNLDSQQGALTLAGVFWNMAIADDEESRERFLAILMGPDGPCRTDGDRQYTRSLAERMIERHKQMFPGLHQAHAR